MTTESGFLDVENGQLYYEASGEGRALVLIHAGVADHQMWDAQMAAFAGRYRVIRYDARGFGKTQCQDATFSNRQDVADLLNHLGVDKTYLMGVSRGGQIATDFTLEFPERVTALIPVAAGLGGSQERQPDPAETRYFEEMERVYQSKDFDRLADMEAKVWVDGLDRPTHESRHAIRTYVRGICAASATRHDQGQPRVLTPPAAGRLSEIHVPTLVVVGDADTPGVLVACNALGDGIPGAHKVVIRDAAHMIPMEKPDEFNRAVLDFLTRVEGL